MGLFGLFRKQGPEAAQKRLEKGNRQLEKGEWNLARLSFEETIAMQGCTEEIRSQAQALLNQSREQLAGQNLEMARSHMEAGDMESALDFIQTAEHHAIQDQTGQDAAQLKQELEAAMDASGYLYGDAADTVGDDVPDFDGYADILLEDYPPFIRDAVEQDAQLKGVMVYLNQENTVEAAPVLEMEDGPAVLYFQSLYLAQSDQIADALDRYRTLATEYGDQLDTLRWAEYIELIRRAEADEPIHEIVNQHPELPVIRSALGFHLERNELEEAKELVSMGMEIMSPRRPDALFIAQAGMVHYRTAAYSDAAEMLDAFKNMMASRGQLALNPQLALALADSLDKTGRTDEALETALHTAQAYGAEKAVEMSRSLAERSSRSDLKRRVERL